MRRTARWPFLIVISLAFLCDAGCRQSIPPPLKEAQLEPPLKSVRLHLDTREMFVRLLPGISLREVVDLRVFGPFRPGVPLERVSGEHGKPKTTRGDYAGTYYGYSHADVKIEIAHERSTSGDRVWEQWAVYAYPSQDGNLLGSPLVKLIEQEHPSELIVAAGDPRIAIEFKGRRVSMLRWYGVRTGDVDTGDSRNQERRAPSN